MKHGRRLTRAQKIFLSGKNLNPENWLFIEETKDKLVLYNKNNKKVKEVSKK